MKSSRADGHRPQRADARDNRERVLQAARTVFAEQGPRASLNKIAQLAGVGPGTLYRNFPNLQSLLVTIIGDDVDVLCARGRDLLDHPSSDEALRAWLRLVALHASAMRGLVATQMIAQPTEETSTALTACHEAILTTGTALLTRAQHQGNAPADLDMADLLLLANAVAWASEQAPADHRRFDRLLALINTGVPYTAPL